MLGHASRRADCHQFASILQLAASRAWTRTRPARARVTRRTTSLEQSFPISSNAGLSSGSRSLQHSLGDSGPVSSRIPAIHGEDCPEEECPELPETPIRSRYSALRGEVEGSTSTVGVANRHDLFPLSAAEKEKTEGPGAARRTADDSAADSVARMAENTADTDTASDSFPWFTAPPEVTHEDQWEEEVDHARHLDVAEHDQRATTVARNSHALRAVGESEALTQASLNWHEGNGDAVQESPTFPQSASAQGLYQDLIRLSVRPLAPPATRTDRLHELLRYHSRHPQIQSTLSYNFLISLAVSIGRFAVAQALLQEMSRRDIPGNLETKKLSVRFWLRQGKWIEVWMRETEGGQRSLPLVLWLEFLNAVKIFEPLVRPASAAERQAHREGCARAAESRSTLLMRHRPALTPTEASSMPPRSMYYLVQWILQNGKQGEALQLTTSYFRRLPTALSRSQRRYCTGIMNLHLKAKAAHVTDLRPTLSKLLALHPELRPDPRSLRILLGAIRTRHGNSVTLDRVRRSFQKKWGDDIVDEEILSFLADRARRDRYVRQLKKVIQEYERRRDLSAPQAWVPADVQPSSSHQRPLHKVVYYDRQKEDNRWKFYRNCLQKFEEQNKQRKKKKTQGAGQG